MDSNRKITKKVTKKFDIKVINRQYFRRKTGLQCSEYLRCITLERGRKNALEINFRNGEKCALTQIFLVGMNHNSVVNT
jgi:hypothetical protein